MNNISIPIEYSNLISFIKHFHNLVNIMEESKNCKVIAVCMPPDLLKRLDYARHDVKRSTYLQKLVERQLEFMNQEFT